MAGSCAIARRFPPAAALCVGLLCGCSEVTSPGLYQLELYDQPVRCTASEATCVDAEGSSAVLEQLSGPAFVSRDASLHVAGLYVFLELQRPSGVRGMLELDVPESAVDGEARVAYSEQEDDRVIFRSLQARGSISLAPRGCPCSDGQLELELTDAGPDGVLGNADDRVRRLSRGQFGPHGDFCRAPRLEPIGDSLQVFRFGCPRPARSTGGNGAPSRYDTHSDVDVELGCGVEEPPPDDYYEEGGCGGEPPPEPEPETGCDPEPEESWDDSGGCEGDSGAGEGCAGDGAGEGCAGDGAGEGCAGAGDAACAADAHAAARPCPRHAGSSRRLVALPRFGVTLPFILPGLLLTFLQRRGRRSRWRKRARAGAVR